MLEDYQNKVCVVTGAASGIGKALCEKLVALGAQVYALDRNKADIEGLSAFVETDLSDKGSIDAAFCALPQVIDRFFGVAGLSGARTSYWLTFTVNFIANKYMTDTYLEKRIPSGGSIAYVTSCGGLMWEKWRKEYVKIMDCKTWDEMVAFMKSVSPKDGVGVMAYTLSKRAMNYYTSLKAVELGKRGIRVNALLPGSTDTGMKKEFEKMAGGQDNLVKENGGAGRLATPQEMADPLRKLMESFSEISSMHGAYADNQYAKPKELHPVILEAAMEFGPIAYEYYDAVTVFANERAEQFREELKGEGYMIQYYASNNIDLTRKIISAIEEQDVWDENITDMDLTAVRPLYDELVASVEEFNTVCADNDQLVKESLSNSKPFDLLFDKQLQAIEWMIQQVESGKPIEDVSLEPLGSISHVINTMNECVDRYNTVFGD